ncbi:unnamed protein product [Chrysoparadoxa australica]
MAEPAQLGITPIISVSKPTPEEGALTKELEEVLRKLGAFESAEQREHRRSVVATVEQLACEWCKDLAEKSGLPPEEVAHAGAVLKTFGSYRLGVHTPDADVDALVVAPQHCTRKDFFSSFVGLLEKRPDVEELFAVPEAYTPVLKFKMQGLDMDLLFCSLPYKLLPSPLNVLDDSPLKGLDEPGVRSLNGVRVAEMILTLVPCQETFRTTLSLDNSLTPLTHSLTHSLRAVKVWARRRGIYSNVLGCMGGVNLAILVAFVCQRYPNASASTTLFKMFKMFSSWKWPNPILLNHIKKAASDGSTRYAVWEQPRDRPPHMMPIITPAYPAMNSSYNVGEPQLRLITEEIARGMAISDKIVEQKEALDEQKKTLKELLAPSEFFQRWGQYIQVDILAENPEDHRRWHGWCESRLRQLILALESPPQVFAYPYTNGFSSPSPDGKENGKLCKSFFIGLSFRGCQGKKSFNLKNKRVVDFINIIDKWPQRSNGMDLLLFVKSEDKLPDICFSGQGMAPRRQGTKRKKPASPSPDLPDTAPEGQETKRRTLASPSLDQQDGQNG